MKRKPIAIILFASAATLTAGGIASASGRDDTQPRREIEDRHEAEVRHQGDDPTATVTVATTVTGRHDDRGVRAEPVDDKAAAEPADDQGDGEHATTTIAVVTPPSAPAVAVTAARAGMDDHGRGPSVTPAPSNTATTLDDHGHGVEAGDDDHGQVDAGEDRDGHGVEVGDDHGDLTRGHGSDDGPAPTVTTMPPATGTSVVATTTVTAADDKGPDVEPGDATGHGESGPGHDGGRR